MSNSFYTASGTPGTGQFGASSPVRSEFLAIQAGFDKMPALGAGVANCAIVVNPGGNGLTNTVGTLALAAPFATTGGFGTTFAEQATTVLTLPAASDTLVGLISIDTLSNKTFVAPALGTPTSGVLTNCTGLPNGGLLNPSVTIGSTNVALGATAATIAGLTLTAPVLGTPTALVLTNATGTPSALGLANATGTPSSIGLANGAGLPISTGVSGLGTGVASLLSGASSGTGGPAGTTSPTFTGTITGAAANFSGAFVSTNASGFKASAFAANCTYQSTAINGDTFYTVQIGGSGGVTLSPGATAWAAASDERLKTDFMSIPRGALALVSSWRAGTYRYLTDDESIRRVGLIAQDVQQTRPEAVSEGPDGFLELRLPETIPDIVAAMAEIKARLEALETK